MTRRKIIGLLLVTIALGASISFGQDERRERPRNRGRDAGLRVADLAPGFVLKSLDGKDETDLTSFRDKKPVVLIFGSYT